MKLSLFPHGGSKNHGCEAIVRSTVKILLKHSLVVFCNQITEDEKYKLDQIVRLLPSEKKIHKISICYFIALIKYHLLKIRSSYDELLYKHVIQDARCRDFVLCIGGDNYCYSGMYFYYLVNRMMDNANVKRILWGASIEPSVIDDKMLDDLQGYYKIIARESLTYKTLRDKGLFHTFLYPDPAFVLDRKDLPLPNGFVEGNTVGINVSPMVIDYEKIQGLTLNNYIYLMKFIIEETDMQIALIPHVIWQDNDDRKPLHKLYDYFKYTGRVCIVCDCDAEELKGYVARCRFMVAARTHASIAAYSTKVPTLVVGYSIKARGIAMDIFGSEEHFVLPVQSLKEEHDLTDEFRWIMHHESDIRKYMDGFMPGYIEKAYHIKDELQ